MTVPSVTSDQLFTALGQWLEDRVVPAGVQVVQALENGVPTPATADPASPNLVRPVGWVSMQTVQQLRLATDLSDYLDPAPDPGSLELSASSEWIVQVDFYGPAAEDWAKAAAILFRSSDACTYFQAKVDGLAPLYEEDPRQVPLLDGEHQFERRLSLSLHFNYTPVVQVPQDFADTLDAGTVSVEATFQP